MIILRSEDIMNFGRILKIKYTWIKLAIKYKSFKNNNKNKGDIYLNYSFN